MALDTLTIVTLLWFTLWLGNLALSGKVWIWGVVSAIPTPLIPLVWFVLFIAALISSDYVSVGLLIVSIPLWYGYVDIVLWKKPKHKDSLAGEQIRVLCWNTEHWTKKTTNGSLVHFLQKNPADIYLLQEAWLEDLNPVDAIQELGDYFPSYTIKQAGELITISKFPVVDQVSKKVPGIFGCMLRTDLDIKGKVLSVYNIHIPVHIPIDDVRNVKVFVMKMKNLFRQRIGAWKLIREDVDNNVYPIIMGGDFNSSKLQNYIKPFLARFDDAFYSTRVGIPRTFGFGGKLRLWRIDWMLHNDKVSCEEYKTIKPPRHISDHVAIVTEYGVPTSKLDPR